MLTVQGCEFKFLILEFLNLIENLFENKQFIILIRNNCVINTTNRGISLIEIK